MTDLVVCPACRGTLVSDGTTAKSSCGAEYEVRDGIPVLVAGASPLSQQQAEWFDHEADAEWEIERPNGSPPVYRGLLEEKFRRAVAGLDLAERTVLCVCAGSGMDAEFLARAGARVIALDISLGAVRRAIERARRHRFDLVPVVGDVERLPFADSSVDVVYVHDGLHHLKEPLSGLDEMTRVARSAVCIAEPADAALTKIAVRFGLAQAFEDAGNRVARLDRQTLEDELRSRGFAIAHSERYAMFYRHTPGRLVRACSHRPADRIARLGFTSVNTLVGRFGNKLAVVAVRP